jgi:hypothetical protein
VAVVAVAALLLSGGGAGVGVMVLGVMVLGRHCCAGGGGCDCGWLIKLCGLFWVTQPGLSDHGYLIPYFSQADVGRWLSG